MCGIAGKFSYFGHSPVEASLIKKMTDAISHRGPDGEGQYVNGQIGLGHRRLAIIDLHTGSQPMCNEDGSIWIVFNGEIYNYQALRSELLSLGHIFKSNTDTEVIVHLYEELGHDCVTRLQGMFAFAIWDNTNKSLFVARDRVGIKPLYYMAGNNAFIFASEIKSILADPSVEKRVNEPVINRFLTYYYLPGNETFFNNILKLEPGYTLTIKANNNIIKRQYWNLNFTESTYVDSFEQAVDELQHLLRTSVGQHLMSDVPLGVLLSGGIDSTGVLRYATELSDSPLHTFTVGFDGQDFPDERPYAKLASEKFGTLHNEITIRPSDFFNLLPKYVWHMEEPICEPPAFALYLVSKLAHDSSVKVLLSGEGGDEAFGGYYKYRNLLALEKLKSILGPGKKLLSLSMGSLAKLGWHRIDKYAKIVELPLEDYYFSCTSTPETPFNKLKYQLYDSKYADSLLINKNDLPTKQYFAEARDYTLLNKLLYVDTKSWLPDDLLVKADKMTMATSVELRVPLLDHKLLEFAASLPHEYKVKGLTTKRILKAALKQSVPPEILNRKKVGFPVPYGKWLRNELKDYVFDTILKNNSFLSNYFSHHGLKSLLESNQTDSQYSQEIFGLLILELMHHQFLK